METQCENALAAVGGKGANLGELYEAGLPVPVAFCVTTDAYRYHLEASSLMPAIAEQLKGIDYDDVGDLDRRAETIRRLIVSAPVPREIAAAITEDYRRLETELGSDVRVAVRSSATAEDLPGTSFAGQQDTYLHVSGADNVIQHVKRCWASLWTARAVSYRNKQGFRHEDVLIAVVVQEMFPSEIAGVLFSVNPLTSNPHELLLNASWGLGEAIVSGAVNPDQYIVDKKSLAVKEKQIHDKKIMTVRSPNGIGTIEKEVDESKRMAETLPDAVIRELCGLAVKIDQLYGFPQDIEWGYAGGKLAILQAREVTATDCDFYHGYESWKTPAALESMTDERWLWSRAFSDESQTGSSTPLFHSYMPGEVMGELRHNALVFTEQKEFLGFGPDRFVDIPYFRRHGARSYYNLDVERERIRRFIPPFARDEATLHPFPAAERERIKNMRFNWIAYLWLMVKLHVTHREISLVETPDQLFDNLERWVRHADATWDKIDLESATTKEILATKARANAPNQICKLCTLPFTFYLFTLPQALKKLLELWCRDDNPDKTYNKLVSGILTKTHEESIAVWRLAQKIRQSPALRDVVEVGDVRDILTRMEGVEEGREFHKDIKVFVKEYGHRGGAERDPIHYRWRHKPEMVFHSIRAMLRLDEEDGPEAVHQRAHAQMMVTKEACIAKARKGVLGFMKAPLFGWFTELVQDYIRFRDFERFYNDKEMSRPRDMYTAIARKFIRRNLMRDEEDIFFLSQEEVLEVEDGKLAMKEIAIRVRARRRVFERYARREPPKFIRGWTFFDDDEVSDGGEGLRGVAGSSGVVTGRARVCRDLSEIGSVKKGEILVTVATDPAWTSIFSIIGGVVVETGGVTAHAVMISREYDLPCVSNLSRACDLIPQGALITVDGSKGRVFIHDEVDQR